MKRTTLEEFAEVFLPYQIVYTANYNNSFRREFQSHMISSEISADELAILCLIDYEPEISQTDIAKYLFKGKAHIGKILNEMESKGYLTRVVATRNNTMIKRNILSKKALDIVKLGKQKTLIVEEKMNKEFSEKEEEQFISYLKRFREVLGSIVDVKLK